MAAGKGGGKPAAKRSPLPAKTNQRRNTQTGRDQMSAKNFALPKGTGSKPDKDQYRIDDPAHARNALARVSQFGTASEQRTVRAKVKAKYPSIGSDSTGGGKQSSGKQSTSKQQPPSRGKRKGGRS